MEGTTQVLQSPSLVGSYLSTWNPVVTLVLIRKDLILEGLPCHRTENKQTGSRYIYRVIRSFLEVVQVTKATPKKQIYDFHPVKPARFFAAKSHCEES